MKLRFSLRMLLIGTVVVAAAAFVALRSRPSRVAEKFQAAARQGDWSAATAMIDGAGVEQTLDQPYQSKADSWKIESFEFSPQSPGQWLRGECVGKLVVTSHSSGESNDAVWSSYETSQCDVTVTAQGVRILKFTKGLPAVVGAPKPLYDTDYSIQSANE